MSSVLYLSSVVGIFVVIIDFPFIIGLFFCWFGVRLFLLGINAYCTGNGDVSRAVCLIFAASTGTVILLIGFMVVVVRVTSKRRAFAFVFIRFCMRSPFNCAKSCTVMGLPRTFTRGFCLFVFSEDTFDINDCLLRIQAIITRIFMFNF